MSYLSNKHDVNVTRSGAVPHCFKPRYVSSCKWQFHPFLSLPQATPFLLIPSRQQQHLCSHMMTWVRLVWLKTIHFLNTNNKNRLVSHWLNLQHQHGEGISVLPLEVGFTSTSPSLTHQWSHWGTAALITYSYKKDSKSAQSWHALQITNLNQVSQLPWREYSRDSSI